MENNKTIEKPVDKSLENSQADTEKITDKGQERYEKISKSISTAKTKLSDWISRGARGLGRLMKGAAIGVLSSPEATVAGGKFVVNKTVEETKTVTEGAKIIAETITGTVVEGVKSAIDDINKMDKFIGKKAEQAGEWIGYKAAAVEDFTTKKYHEAKTWVNNKKEVAGAWVVDAALITEAVASLVAEPVVEKYNQTKEKIEKGYENILTYGQKSIESANLWARNKKDSFIEKKNAIRFKILERKEEIQNKRLEMTKSKLEQYKKVGQMEAVIAA